MSRTERLLDLIQALRRHRRPVSGAQLADATGVSLRTVYRDIQTLIAKGAPIEGEAGVGYVLRPGFTLPPLMFSDQEIEAIVLGSRMVAARGDDTLAGAARNALAKIAAVMPESKQDNVAMLGLLVGASERVVATGVDLAGLRGAIRDEQRLRIAYEDEAGRRTERHIWPVAITFCERVRILAAWCELRDGFRHFRTDRIASLAETGEKYPRRRRALMKEWREIEGLAEAE
ncbi:MAG: YafY family protein [Reyranella sp.]|nr:YafY family protein [Reyranella sp.]